ncbi:hypothetical protein JST97_19920 [bacterium]|nr:hypothetical protein [bacterium]
MKKVGDNWGLNFDLKLKGIPGPSMRKGLRFEKGGDLLRDRQNEGIEGGYLVKRGTQSDTWELAGPDQSGARTSELENNFGVWRTNCFKQLFTSEVKNEDVTPLSEVFSSPSIAGSESTAGGMITHQYLGRVDDALLVDRKSKYSDMVLNVRGPLVGISSQENYDYDDPFELILVDQMRREQKEFFGR